MSEKIVLYALEGCPFCQKVKNKLAEKSLKYEEIIIDRNDKPEEVQSTGGTVPVIKIGDKVIGDSSRICEYLDANF